MMQIIENICSDAQVATSNYAFMIRDPKIEWLNHRMLAVSGKKAELAAKLGIHPSAVTRIFAGKRQIKSQEVPVVAEFLGVGTDQRIQNFVKSENEANPATTVVPEERRNTRDLPVYGAAEGGNGGMVVTPEAIDWIVRPGAVANSKDAYAVYIVGDSMEPRIEHGEIVVVHPNRPVRQRDDIILVKHEPDGSWLALCKRLIRWNKTEWTVFQYNPQKEFNLSRSEWSAFPITSRQSS